MYKTYQDEVVEESIKIIKEVLLGEYVTLSVGSLSLNENVEQERSEVSCVVSLGGAPDVEVNGAGFGLVDALYSALVNKLSGEYLSLKDVRFVDFTVNINPRSVIKKPGTDAKVFVDIMVENSSRDYYHFSHSARSMNTAAVLAVLKTVEYFLNCEKAILKLSICIKDAEARGRIDMKDKYVNQMCTLVKNNSYVESLRYFKNKKN